MDDRALALQAAFDALSGRISMPFHQFCAAFAEWEIEPIQSPPIGAIFVKGNEIHVAVRAEYHGRWFTRRVLNFVRSLLIERGPLVTMVMPGNDAGERFIRRLGFEKRGNFYEMRKLKL